MREVRWHRAVCLLAFALGACANPYQKFYRAAPGVPPDVRTMPGYVPPEGPLQLFTTTDMQRDFREALRRGYVLIGQSAFQGAGRGVTEANLRAQAESVGAQMVLLSSAFSHTVTGAVPMTLPNNSTSYTSGTATAYGPGGTVNAYGSATTTTYGATTTMLPYSVARYEYGAVYLVRRKSRLGVFPKALDDTQRQRVQSNSAVIIDLVIDGSPAFRADILPGDIILSFGGQPPGPPADFLKRIGDLEGQEVEIELLRGDQHVAKRVRLDHW